jgi:hypothetical protein
MRGLRIPRSTLALALSLTGLLGAWAQTARASVRTAPTPAPTINPPGGPLSSTNTTPFPPSHYIVGARWTSARYASPPNQSGDILATVWSEDGTYMMMDDGGVNVPESGGLWRQSLARVTGTPPQIRFAHVGEPASPPPRTRAEIGNNPDNDDGPLGPYYSSGFTDVQDVFYATQQRDWHWREDGVFSGLVGIAYSQDHGETWHAVGKSFDAPLGNLTFVDAGAPGAAGPGGYVYAIGTPREFNASSLVLGRVRPGIQNITDPARWQWFAGAPTAGGATGGAQTAGAPAGASSAGAPTGSDRGKSARWSPTLGSARPLLQWPSHITYPEMTYDKPLKRYLLTFTYSYASQPPAIWTAGAELVILAAPTPTGPFSFVARSSGFGPSNGYDAGFPSQWISPDGRDLWLKWAANFLGCAKGIDCSGKYGFNVARLHLTTRSAPARSINRDHLGALAIVSGALSLLFALAFGRRRQVKTRRAARRREVKVAAAARRRQVEAHAGAPRRAPETRPPARPRAP